MDFSILDGVSFSYLALHYIPFIVLIHSLALFFLPQSDTKHSHMKFSFFFLHVYHILNGNFIDGSILIMIGWWASQDTGRICFSSDGQVYRRDANR